MDGQVQAQTEQICRTCMKCRNEKIENYNFPNTAYQLYSIYDFVDDYENKKIQIFQLLSTAVPKLPKIEIMDALPKQICTYCLEKLSACYEFQNSCINSDLKLRNSLETNNLKQNLSDPLQCTIETTIKQEIEVESNSILETEEFIMVRKSVEINENSIEEPEEAVKLEPHLDVVETNTSKKDTTQIVLESINELIDEEVPKDGNVWRCKNCSISFLHKSQLMLHLKQNSNECGEGKKIYSARFNCEFCDVTFTEKRNLKRHKLNKHNMDTINIIRGSNKSSNEPPIEATQSHNESSTTEINCLIKFESTDEQYSNINCNTQSQSDNESSTVVNVIENLYIGTNRPVTIKKIVNQHTNSSDTLMTDKSMLESGSKNFKMWECKKCLNLFYHKKNLSRHMKTIHNEELPKDTQAVNGVENFKRLSAIYKCDECDRVFHKISSLNLHKHHHLHPSAAKICQYCNKTFKKMDKLKDHENTHLPEPLKAKPFLCAECGKTFGTRINFVQHRLRHSAERRYQCPQCPKKFFAKSDVLGHIRQVHNSKKPFVCEVCGAAFKRPSCLKIHMSIHTGDKRFKCDFCDKRFPAKEHMQRHRRTHTGEKPFKCKYCSRCYKSPSDLRKHLGLHLGEKTFLCELCPAAFRLARELRVHFATHRLDDEETKAQNKQARLEAQQQLMNKLKKEFSNLEGKTSLD